MIKEMKIMDQSEFVDVAGRIPEDRICVTGRPFHPLDFQYTRTELNGEDVLYLTIDTKIGYRAGMFETFGVEALQRALYPFWGTLLFPEECIDDEILDLKEEEDNVFL